MGRIIQLDSKLQNMIAAGEVIESIANVVKELVENALDAGATRIEIALEEAGIKRILVVDDGFGMDADDAKMAFSRHATSKIKSEYDLFHIASLGFRGEALPSIAAVARVELTTAEAAAEGIRIIVEANDITKIETASRGQGTSVSVTRLFYHTPARFKYLRPLPLELQQTSEVISRFALAYPEVAFSLANNGKVLLKTSGNGKLHDVLATIYGIDAAKRMLPFQARSRDYLVSGYLSEPSETRASRKQIMIFVNRRPIRDNLLAATIIDAYGQLLPGKRYPLVALMITVDPQLVDVNVHPTKLEIKFSEGEALRKLIYQAIRSQLADKPVMGGLGLQEIAEYLKEGAVDPSGQLSLFDKPQDAGALKHFPQLEYIGQYRGTYLLFQNEEGLYLMDQHAAAERIRYERYLSAMATPTPGGYRLLVPLILSLAPADRVGLTPEIIAKIAEFGVKLTIDPTEVKLEEVPHWFPRGQELAYADTLVTGMLEGAGGDIASLRNDLAILLACKHSLKANAFIDKTNALELLADLSHCEHPYTCPHGRPVFVKLSLREIETMFHRTS